MEKDFHFYAIAALARFAGFNSNDAIIIGHASQYVDDADENKPFKIGDRRFDPVRTAYVGIKSLKWRVQRDIYLPFHFFPPSAIDYIVKPNPVSLHHLITQVENEANYKAYLIGLGIALHTLADTWAHQGFTGKREKFNDVTGIHVFEKDTWKHPIIDNIKWDFAPQIGHAEAGHYPDVPFHFWKYTAPGQKDKVYKRNNVDLFLQAAKAIYEQLLIRKKNSRLPTKSWSKIEPKIKELLQKKGNLAERCKNWQKTFSQNFAYNKYTYDPRQWRREALKPKKDRDINWTNFNEKEFGKLQFEHNPILSQTSFALFHKMALKQRHFVVQSLMW